MGDTQEGVIIAGLAGMFLVRLLKNICLSVFTSPYPGGMTVQNFAYPSVREFVC